MKDVSKETLQAIQSNVKVEETQSLERSVDNLLQASWKDFEVADLQPNLIPNGWDSFVPYGSGENYVENWDFSEQVGWQGHMIPKEIKNGKAILDFTKDSLWGGLSQIINFEEKVYTVRVKARVSQGGIANEVTIQWGSTVASAKELKNNWQVLEWEIIPKGTLTGFYFYQRPSNTIKNIIEVDWISVSELDNQHLVVEKTPLENGLTRIQTWGGNSEVKLQSSVLPRDFIKTISMYVKTDKYFRIWDRWTTEGDLVKPNGVEGYVTVPVGRTAPFSYIQAKGKEDNLDFIASTPTIVEGDKHNPVLVVDQLDDGTEHVRVYGAYPDTKLVYKGGKGFIGENYKLTSNIKNEGVELGINTSLGSSTIPKGDSKLEIEGELQEQDFAIELGARDV